MNVILIGMPGCGKSTIGVLLAKTLLCDFVDTDLVIQNKYRKSLCDIISEYGLTGFKKIENEVLSKIECVNSVVATGGSAVAAIDFIKQRGGKDIVFMCLIAAPEGLKVLEEAHPDIDIYIASLDERLNENAYILPGLGDAGDRLYGTK